jgi:alpha-L-rhamnosidase
VNELPKVSYPEPINRPENLSLIGRMNASSMVIDSEKLPLYEAFRANDENLETHWKANSTTNEWLEVDWFKPQTFNKVVIHEDGNNILNFKIQYFDNNEWKEIANGSSCGVKAVHEFSSITTTKCRLLLLETKQNAAIAEFKIFNTKTND